MLHMVRQTAVRFVIAGIRMGVHVNMNLGVLDIIVLPAIVLALGCSSAAGPEPEAAATDRPEPITKTPAVGERPSIENALGPVYFATDSAQLLPEARDAIARAADTIAAHPEWGRVTVEGHCDERGSDAYNQALGARRAEAVASHLISEGVPTARVSTRSVGSSEPAVAGHDERAWRLNRRSELDIEEARTAGQSTKPRNGLAANDGAPPRD